MFLEKVFEITDVFNGKIGTANQMEIIATNTFIIGQGSSAKPQYRIDYAASSPVYLILLINESDPTIRE